MRTYRRFFHDIWAFVRGRATDDDLSGELDAFLEASVAHKMQSGMSREEATRTARLEVGSALAVRDAVGDVGWTATWEAAWRDVRYGLRSLARNGSFTLAAVTTLALGVGITTAVFSIVNTVLLQPLPYQNSDRLVRIVERAAPRTAGGPLLRRTSMTWSEMVEWRAGSTTLSDLAYTMSPPTTLMRTPEGSARLEGALVSSNVFSMLGARALLGRTLDSRDEQPGSNAVVISAGAWQRYLQSDPGVIGRTIALKTQGFEAGFLDGMPLTIVGVMAREVDYPVPYCDYWAPITAASPVRSWPGSRSVIARLRDGISAEAATDEANVIGEALRPKPTSGPLSQPLPEGTRRFDVEPIKEQAIASSRPALRVLALAVGVVLLIACANVATLLLARGTARHREVAVRLALGASRSRIARQLLTESAILTTIGGGVGMLFAVGCVQLLRSLASPNAQGPFRIPWGGDMIPRLHEVAVDGRMLAIAVGLSAFTALVISVLPVLRLSRTDHAQAMGVRAANGARHDTHLRNLLVAGQVALATVLLVGAGLLVNSFSRLTRVDPGWNALGLLTFYLVAPQEHTTQRKAMLIDELLVELRRTPGVQAAGFTYAGPLMGLIDNVGKFVPAGRTPEDMPDLSTGPHIRSVSHDFLQTMGVRLRAGRWLEPRDDAGAPPVIVINRSLARLFFGSEDPVGRMVHVDGRMDLPPQQIVGVVDDMRQGRLDQEPTPQFFVDYRQVLALTQARQMPVAAQERLAFGFLSFVVRTDGDPARLMATMRSLISRVDSNVGIDALLPMEQLVASSLTRQRFYTAVMGVFAAIAMLLSAVGIYGVLAYAVGQRTREFGVRTALGARSRDVLAMVLRQALGLTSIGIGIGLAGAMALTRYIEGMLYDVTPLDPLTYVAVVALFTAVTSIASYVPARRATRIDPTTALRYE
ncbi:MAG TPA: ABC transporter permease [Vicinamibacterales bacterium]|nr:ABC transporter permease [Vicinamibacterales bacterium]